MCAEQAAVHAVVHEGQKAIRAEGHCAADAIDTECHVSDPRSLALSDGSIAPASCLLQLGAAAQHAGSPARRELKTQAPDFRRSRPLASQLSEMQDSGKGVTAPGCSH